MAHKTLIGGTAYDINGGKPLINGTAYSIKSGKTLVGGTAYEVGFVKLCAVTLDFMDSGDDSTSVTINGTTYKRGFINISGVTVYELDVPVGTEITINTATGFGRGLEILLNGTIVLQKSATSTNTPVSYVYVVKSNVKITFQPNVDSKRHIEITEL